MAGDEAVEKGKQAVQKGGQAIAFIWKLKDNIIALGITVLVLLGIIAGGAATTFVAGSLMGVSQGLKYLPVNCKSPPNLFDIWATVEDFLTGIDCKPDCGVDDTEANLEGNQEDYIKSLVGVANAMGVNERGMTIALMTAYTESGLKVYANDGIYDTSRNPADATLPAADRDAMLSTVAKSMDMSHDAVGSDATSIGILQQQIWWGSMGDKNWRNDPDGTVKRLMDPVFQFQKFFDRMLSVPDWQNKPLGQVAQTVQVSAFPDAYNKWEEQSTAVINQYKDQGKNVTLYNLGTATGDGTSDTTEDGNCYSSETGLVLDKNALYQVTAQWAEGRGAAMYGNHEGMDFDCNDSYENVYTPLSGTVILAENGNPSGIGNPPGSVRVKVKDGVVLEFYHMRNTFVTPGQEVNGGDALGECASTGLSTGTHLHLNAYVNESTNEAVKALPSGPGLQPSLRDPALTLEILGVDICPPYVADRKTAAPGASLPGGGYLKCWPAEEWVR